ncbi:MAG: ATP-binding protein [Nitriliruptoraceae bacterium]
MDDRSERRADLHARLHELEERFTLAMTHAPIGMAISRLDGSWVAVNPALCKLLGYPEEELLGDLTFADLTDPEDLSRERVLLDELLAGQRSSYGLDKRYHRSDGSLVWTHTVVSLVRDEQDQPRYFVAQCVDTTDQHRIEDELRHTAAQLERTAAALRISDEIRLAFLRATSHELRTPLTVVAGVADTLRRHHAELSDEQQLELLDRLQVQAHRLTETVTDLLDVDRLTTGLGRATLRPLPLAQVVRTVLDATLTPDRRLDVELTEVVVDGDLPKVERIVANLLDNAVRHTGPGGWIGVRTLVAGDRALLVIEDDGPGLPAAVRERIFEPFVQGPERHNDARPGTGLGLTLVREYVSLHDGTVTAEDREDGGARFTVRLPVTVDDSASSAGSRAQAAPGVPPGSDSSASSVDER